MISNTATYRGKRVDIVGRGTGQLSRQVRICYKSKAGKDVFKLVDESQLTFEKRVGAIHESPLRTRGFTLEPGHVNTIGWPETKTKN